MAAILPRPQSTVAPLTSPRTNMDHQHVSVVYLCDDSNHGGCNGQIIVAFD